jgi:orotidine-5'-phosphate decarboxylase
MDKKVRTLEKDPLADERLILALDSENVRSAMEVLEATSGQVSWVKVSSELMLLEHDSGQLFNLIRDLDISVLVDLQSAYSEQRLRQLTKLAMDRGLSCFSVRPGLARQINLKGMSNGSSNRFEYVAPALVTQIGVGDKPFNSKVELEEFIGRSVHDLHTQGLSGVITSCQELHSVPAALKEKMVLIVPGIREQDIGHQLKHDNQKRKCTVEAALKSGADYIIVGRPITASADPSIEADAFNERIKSILAKSR